MHDRIVIDPNICHGKPVVRGTRTPITVLLDSLAAGDSMELLCQEYDVTFEDIGASIAFASSEIRQQQYVSIPA